MLLLISVRPFEGDASAPEDTLRASDAASTIRADEQQHVDAPAPSEDEEEEVDMLFVFNLYLVQALFIRIFRWLAQLLFEQAALLVLLLSLFANVSF